MNTEIREATEADIPLLHLVFESSVTGLCSLDYKPEQIHAWVARAGMNRWRELVGSDLQLSLAARPFFEKQGYEVEREQTILVNGVAMRNLVMRKLVGCCNSL